MSVDELFLAVDDLSEPDFESLVSRVLWLRARRKASVLEPAETQLLLQINRVIPSELYEQYRSLRDKRDDENLTEQEHQELLRVSDKMELFSVQRLEALAKLADLRQVSLLQLMDNLGIQGASFD
jgi:hypothetical protein